MAERVDWTVSQVAKEFQCRIETVIRWIHSGRLKAYQLGGKGPWRIPWAEVERVKAEWMYKPDVTGAL